MEAAPLVILFTVAGIILYIFPTIMASSHNHRQLVAVFFLNVLFGWTLVGWVLALVWAFQKGVTMEKQKEPEIFLAMFFDNGDVKYYKHSTFPPPRELSVEVPGRGHVQFVAMALPKERGEITIYDEVVDQR